MHCREPSITLPPASLEFSQGTPCIWAQTHCTIQNTEVTGKISRKISLSNKKLYGTEGIKLRHESNSCKCGWQLNINDSSMYYQVHFTTSLQIPEAQTIILFMCILNRVEWPCCWSVATIRETTKRLRSVLIVVPGEVDTTPQCGTNPHETQDCKYLRHVPRLQNSKNRRGKKKKKLSFFFFEKWRYISSINIKGFLKRTSMA